MDRFADLTRYMLEITLFCWNWHLERLFGSYVGLHTTSFIALPRVRVFLNKSAWCDFSSTKARLVGSNLAVCCLNPEQACSPVFLQVVNQVPTSPNKCQFGSNNEVTVLLCAKPCLVSTRFLEMMPVAISMFFLFLRTIRQSTVKGLRELNDFTRIRLKVRWTGRTTQFMCGKFPHRGWAPRGGPQGRRP